MHLVVLILIVGITGAVVGGIIIITGNVGGITTGCWQC